MGKLFGTDGIRGVFNEEPVTPGMGYRVGRAVVNYFRRGGGPCRIVVGRDTRLSGKVLQDAVVAGILSKGADPVRLGVLPTPAVAFMAKDRGADAGIVISASHNPFEYNGFKVFSGEGYKLPDKAESEIEELILAHGPAASLAQALSGVKDQESEDAGGRYISFLRSTLPEASTFKGMRIILDCAHGATYRVAPLLFQGMGAEVESLFINPNGKNINEKCGSQSPEALCRRVRERSADVGLAFDGDGDRLVAVDEKGRVLTGDQILVICAKGLRDEGGLKNNLVVSTVMSNMGLHAALKELGIKHVSSSVGDRHVLEKMMETRAVLGGEESGHIIFLNHHTTGDGLLCGLQLLEALRKSGQPLSRLAGLMRRFPQVLENVPVRRKPEISKVPEIMKVLQRAERALGKRGRVLVRYSGTEPLCRIMVEGEQGDEIGAWARRIAEVVRRQLA